MHLLGCRFHWDQALQRWWAEAGVHPPGRAVHRPQRVLQELPRALHGEGGVIEELREVKKEDGILEAAKHSFVDYLERK